MTLGENSKIMKKFDGTSKNYEISKYWKNIGMQKSTLEKMLIIPGRHGFSAFFIAWIKALVYAGEKSIPSKEYTSNTRFQKRFQIHVSL